MSTDPDLATAIELLHGDHVTLIVEVISVTVLDSHKIGNPRTTLANGQAYCLYSMCTIDVWGDRGSAE